MVPPLHAGGQTYLRAIEVSPSALAPNLRLAQLYATRPQDAPKATAQAKKARALAPTDPAVAATLGRLIFQAGDHRWALSLLQEAAQRVKDSPDLLYDLAWAQFSLGRVSDAQATMQSATKLGVSGTVAESMNRFIEMCAFLVNPGTSSPAVAHRVQQILQQDPNHAPSLMAAAQLYFQQSNVVAARQPAEKVLSQFQRFSPAQRLLASLHLADPPDYQKAYDHAVKALEAYPEDPEVARSLGIAVYRTRC